MNRKALLVAITAGSVAQVAMVVAGHWNASIASLYAVGGMGFSLLAGVVYLVVARPESAKAASVGGAVAGGACAFVGILIAYLMMDVPATLLVLGTVSSIVTGAMGASGARMLRRA